MILETFKNFKDFELLDSGNGYRLERWGDVILQRPDPQIIWGRSLNDAEWDKAWAIFKSASGDDKGKWEITKPLPKTWIISFPLHPLPNPPPKREGELHVKLLLKLSPFKHTGLFAEQAANWEWTLSKLKVPSYQVKSGPTLNFPLDNFQLANKFKVLNLFAYTGGATMVLAKAGCQVTHVDASKPAITWANENYKLNFGSVGPRHGVAYQKDAPGRVPTEGVRWILDDCVKFVKRELKRGTKYDGIIMDPPAFGHSPDGKTWKFNNDLPGLLKDCVNLLSDDARFLVINGYATNSSALALNNLLEDATKSKPGKIEFGELCLKQKTKRIISTGIFARWSN